MAKIFYSGLVNTIKGKLGTTIHQKFRGTDYQRQSPDSWANPNTYRQRQLRSNFTTLRTAFESLPPIAKKLWNDYTIAAYLKSEGWAGYLHLNATLLNASHAALCAHTYPPPYPSTPEHPAGFCVYGLSTTCMSITWTGPLLTCQYVIARFRLHNGFCCAFPAYGLCPTDGYRPSWRFIETVRSDQGHILFQHTWPSNTRLHFQLHTIDTWGRRSPFTHTLTLRNP